MSLKSCLKDRGSKPRLCKKTVTWSEHITVGTALPASVSPRKGHRDRKYMLTANFVGARLLKKITIVIPSVRLIEHLRITRIGPYNLHVNLLYGDQPVAIKYKKLQVARYHVYVTLWINHPLAHNNRFFLSLYTAKKNIDRHRYLYGDLADLLDFDWTQDLYRLTCYVNHDIHFQQLKKRYESSNANQPIVLDDEDDYEMDVILDNAIGETFKKDPNTTYYAFLNNVFADMDEIENNVITVNEFYTNSIIRFVIE